MVISHTDMKVFRVELILETRKRSAPTPRICVLQRPRRNKYTVDLKRAASKDSISERGSYYFNMNSDLQPTREK